MQHLINKTLYLVVFLAVIQVYGQKPTNPERDRIKTLKVAFITEQLNLSSKEAQNFWPIYNENEKLERELRHKEGKHFSNVRRNLENSTEGEASKILSDFISLQKEKSKLEQDYVQKLKKVISDKKVLLLFKAEYDFRNKLFQEYRQRNPKMNQKTKNHKNN